MGNLIEYKPVMSAAQRWAFWIIVPFLALLGANSLYLLAIPEANQNQFYLYMFLLHLVLGLLLMAPFVVFIVMHVRAAWGRENKRAIRAGLVLLSATLVLLLSGLIMTFRLKPAQASSPLNQLIYWAHVLTPLLAGGMYIMHRRAGPRVHWNWGFAWAICVAAFVGAMSLMHGHDPRQWHQVGSPEGEKYFEPSQTRTVTGNFIPERALMMESYCIKCHPDAYGGWFHSAHHFSSFNNPAYRFSIRETRKVTMRHDPDGIARGARWCAGCHDQVPFLSGKFDDPNFDDVNDATAHAGITCTVCHGVTNINSTRGNGDYTIDEPIHYPFAYSDNPALQWINNQLVKAKPTFHKRTFLKPFHRTSEFCSVCHKVSLPFELNQYKEFLRGQNHYDPFLLSGVSGHGVRSFYYPPKARENCAACHMPLAESDDFGSRDFAGAGQTSIHTHLFQSANTGMAAFRGDEKTIQAHRDFLVGADPDIIGPTMRIDIFGLKPGATIDAPLHAPIRPELPTLLPGTSYLLEIVLRTLNVGHLFTQGTVDSNEIWVELIAKSGDRVIGHGGRIGDDGQVDPWSHFVNVHMLDRHGNRVDRRNAQDIFTPLYNNQMPPGTGQVVHYRLDVPPDISKPIEITAALRYRKFDRTYMDYVFGKGGGPDLPVVSMCEDTVTLPVAGVVTQVPEQASPIKPAWQRWNDYGIGLLLEGDRGAEKGELRQAEEVFRTVAGLRPQDGYVNLARVYIKEGRLEEATEVLQKAESLDPPANWWTVAWFNGIVNKQNGRLDAAIRNFESIVNNKVPDRGFDFSLDYVLLNELGLTQLERSKQERGSTRTEARNRRIREAIGWFEGVLAVDSENLTAHYNLSLCYRLLGTPLPEADARLAMYLEFDLQDEAKFVESIGEKVERGKVDFADLFAHVEAFCKQRRAANLPTLSILRQVNQMVRTVCENRVIGAEFATVLSMLHRNEYLAYKPDDNARDKAIAIYRTKNPPANHAAQSIVIYPLTGRHRDELSDQYHRTVADVETAAPGSALTVVSLEDTIRE